MWDPTTSIDESGHLIIFQSTGPVWDPTCIEIILLSEYLISIHGSRVGPDYKQAWDDVLFWAFQSTGPVWDPTCEGIIA